MLKEVESLEAWHSLQAQDLLEELSEGKILGLSAVRVWLPAVPIFNMSQTTLLEEVETFIIQEETPRFRFPSS